MQTGTANLEMQAENFRLIFIIFFCVVTAVLVLFLFLSILRILKIRKIKNAKEAKLFNEKGFVWGLKNKLIVFNLLLATGMMAFISSAFFFAFTTRNKKNAGREFLSFADAELTKFYPSSLMALNNKNFELAKSLVKNLSQKNQESKFLSLMILGYNPYLKKNTDLDFVWASSSTKINNLSNTDFNDAKKIELKKQNIIYGLNEKLNRLNIEALKKTAVQLVQLRSQKNNSNLEPNFELEHKMLDEGNKILNEFANASLVSFPTFTVDGFFTDGVENYFFYRPIAFINTENFNQVIHGAIVIELSTKDIMSSLNLKKTRFIQATLLVFVIMLLVGMVSAIYVANNFTNPLFKIIDNVTKIANSVDKTKLEKNALQIKRSDEIGLLANKINEMSNMLVASTLEINDLIIGQDVQKMFLPLIKDTDGKKLNIAHNVFSNCEFFGYYSGAKNISGDYFDYIQLDKNHFVMIKCDVSGKGVSAALIMVQIATLFVSYFKNWNLKTNGTNINFVMEKISDFLVDNCLPGRFAAITLCLLDAKNKKLFVCNAGDNIIHIYRNEKKAFQKILLSKSLVAGVQKTYELATDYKYKVECLDLTENDIVVLYTDGIEDSRQTFLTNTENQVKYESFGAERIKEIIEAFLQKRKYTFTKKNSVGENVLFELNFSKSSRKISELVLIVVAMEAFFRMKMVQDEKASQAQKLIDKNLDAVLQKYLTGYDGFDFATISSNTKTNMLEYESVFFDEQFDDIAILAFTCYGSKK